ncbi:MAG: alpha-L-fucosidase [Armatimonadetes bacterium]|nr:alpha-L-fucosidase [Armatimonadota bacterium]
MTWFDTCYRKLFFDFHTHSTAEQVAARFDAERWAEALASVGAQAVSSFAKCGHGWKYYRKGRAGYLHPKLPSGLDMLEDTIAACHRRGIRVIAYYHTFNSEPVAQLHPGWVEEDASGQKRGHSICHHSRVAEEEWLPQAEEIARHYAIDGIFFDGTYAASVCYCPACRAACGLESPPAPKAPPGPAMSTGRRPTTAACGSASAKRCAGATPRR